MRIVGAIGDFKAICWLDQLRFHEVSCWPGRGMSVWQLEFGRFVLLHPERINSYAAAVGRTVRSHLQQIGVIPETP